MTNNELKRKTLSTYPCQMPRHCWIVGHLSVQGHIETPHSSLHGPYTTIFSRRLCCHPGNPSRLIRYKSLCPLVLQLPIGAFQLPRTLTPNERPRIIPASVLLASPLSILLPPSQELFFQPEQEWCFTVTHIILPNVIYAQILFNFPKSHNMVVKRPHLTTDQLFAWLVYLREIKFERFQMGQVSFDPENILPQKHIKNLHKCL